MGIVSGKNRWIDPAIHIVAAAIIIMPLLISPIHPVFAAFINAAFWLGREAAQDIVKHKYRKQPIWPFWPFRYSRQKWIEFLTPAVAGFIVAVMMLAS